MTDLLPCPKGAIERFTENRLPVRVLIDEEDAQLFDSHTWRKYPSCRYVQSYFDGKTQALHRVILNAPTGSAVDHINGDGKSAYKGIVVLKNGRFRAKINSDGKRYELGVYDDEHDAVIAYNAAAKVLHGEFAYMNEIPTRTPPPGYALVRLEGAEDRVAHIVEAGIDLQSGHQAIAREIIRAMREGE